jgi:hypothetical protein
MAPEVSEYIMGTLASVRSVPVKNSAIALADLGVRPPVKKEVRASVCVCLWGLFLSARIYVRTYMYIWF